MRTRVQFNNRQTNQVRRGYVLIAVLIVIVVLSLAAYRYSDMASAEYRATNSVLKSSQAKALADSGIHYAVAMLADPDAFQATLGNNPFDNSAVFKNHVVELGNGRRGYFDVVSVDYTQEMGVSSLPLKYGVIDEASRINLNAVMQVDPSGTVALNMLKKLPNMTDDIANSIIDWIDSNDEPRSGGAEASYYQSLANPYRCKNGPLDSVEELLLVKGVTPDLLIGNDFNRNGRLDADEATSGAFNSGWAPYLTVYSRERNLNSSGSPRINLNGKVLKTVYTQLKEAGITPELAAYIIAYRYLSAPTANSKNSIGTPTQLVSVVDQAMSKSSPRSTKNISSVYQLFGTSVSVPGPPGQPATVYSFPIQGTDTATDLGALLDKTSTVADQEVPARINVGTASAAVLATLPGLEQADVDLIMSTRPPPGTGDTTDLTYQTSAWLYTQAKLSAAKLQAIDRYVNGRSHVYRIQAIGYFEKGGPVARIEAVVDANNGKPRVIYYRDLTELGRAIDPQR